jgi:hypothetical protein
MRRKEVLTHAACYTPNSLAMLRPLPLVWSVVQREATRRIISVEIGHGRARRGLGQSHHASDFLLGELPARVTRALGCDAALELRDGFPSMGIEPM